MARIFRIKNGFLRWLAGLFVAIGAGIIWIAKIVAVLLCAMTVVTLVGLGVKYLSGAIGFPPSDWLFSILTHQQFAETHLVQMFVFGLISLTAIVVAIYVIIAPFYIIVTGYKKAKEYGDKYFDSIGDKKKSNESK